MIRNERPTYNRNYMSIEVAVVLESGLPHKL